MTRLCSLIVLATLAWFVAGPVLAADGGTKLELKELKPTDFWLRTQTLREKTGPGMPNYREVRDQLELWRVAQAKAPEGLLTVSRQLRGKVLAVNGVELERSLFHSRTASTRTNPRGELLDSSLVESPVELFWPALPAMPVPVGYKWNHSLTPSKKFSHHARVEHVFEKADTIDKVPVALIRTSSVFTGKDPRTGSALKGQFDGTMAVALKEGYVVKAIGLLRTVVQPIVGQSYTMERQQIHTIYQLSTEAEPLKGFKKGSK